MDDLKKILGAKLFMCICLAGTALAQEFNLDSMPSGGEVTVPGSAHTMVPISMRVRLGSTDSPQAVSFLPTSSRGGAGAKVRLAIFDRHSDRVQYVVVSPDTPFVYSFQRLSSIMVVPELAVPKGATPATIKLKIVSDKPLNIGR